MFAQAILGPVLCALRTNVRMRDLACSNNLLLCADREKRKKQNLRDIIEITVQCTLFALITSRTNKNIQHSACLHSLVFYAVREKRKKQNLRDTMVILRIISRILKTMRDDAERLKARL